MRRKTTPVVPAFRLRMLVPRVVNTVYVDAGDEVPFPVQEPLASLMVKRGYAEVIDEDSEPAAEQEVTDEPPKKKTRRKKSGDV